MSGKLTDDLKGWKRLTGVFNIKTGDLRVWRHEAKGPDLLNIDDLVKVEAAVSRGQVIVTLTSTTGKRVSAIGRDKFVHADSVKEFFGILAFNPDDVDSAHIPSRKYSIVNDVEFKRSLLRDAVGRFSQGGAVGGSTETGRTLDEVSYRPTTEGLDMALPDRPIYTMTSTPVKVGDTTVNGLVISTHGDHHVTRQADNRYAAVNTATRIRQFAAADKNTVQDVARALSRT